jgi:hypothetical protein
MPGGIGQNGSIEWLVMGNKGNPHGPKGPHGDGFGGSIKDPRISFFKVQLRFLNQAAADAAWTARTQQVTANGDLVVTVQVPAQPPDNARTWQNVNNANDQPNVNPPWEVFVDW